MANRTLRGYLNVHGTNPQFLVEKTIRSRIYDSRFWKEHCFALTAESIIDRALDLEYVGGTYGLQRPSPFLCLLQKMLQLQPERDIVLEYLNAAEFKYLRALAAMYVRLTFRAIQVFELLEPLLDDYRKLRHRDMTGTYSLTYMDVFIDSLLTEERVCQVVLPRLVRRDVLEETEGLAPRASKLEDVLLHGKVALDANGGDDGEESTGGSDDSAAGVRREMKRRTQRAAKIREMRLQQQQRFKEAAAEAARADGREEGEPDAKGEEVAYASQELTDEQGDEGEGQAETQDAEGPSATTAPDAEGAGRTPSSITLSDRRGGAAKANGEANGGANGHAPKSPERG